MSFLLVVNWNGFRLFKHKSAKEGKIKLDTICAVKFMWKFNAKPDAGVIKGNILLHYFSLVNIKLNKRNICNLESIYSIKFSYRLKVMRDKSGLKTVSFPVKNSIATKFLV